jgi:hypothetical protein
MPILGNTEGRIHRRRQGDNPVTEANVFGALAAGRKKDFRRRRMRVLLQEMVLDGPGRLGSEPIRHPDLLDRVLNQSVFRVRSPGPRKLQFIQDAKSHIFAPSPSALG